MFTLAQHHEQLCVNLKGSYVGTSVTLTVVVQYTDWVSKDPAVMLWGRLSHSSSFLIMLGIVKQGMSHLDRCNSLGSVKEYLIVHVIILKYQHLGYGMSS